MHKILHKLKLPAILICLASALLIHSPYLNRCGTANAQSKGLTIMDAVGSTLEHSPDILVKREEIIASQGELQQVRGQFDTTFQAGSSYQHGETPISESLDQKSNTLKNQVKAVKQLRNGVSLNSSVELSRNISEYDPGNPPDPAQNKAGVYLSVSFPLLKGRGVEATGAREMAAELNVEISKMQSMNTANKAVRDTALAYWRYRAAYEIFRQYKNAEKRAEESLLITQAMIAADQAPSSILENAKAKLLSKKTSRISAWQSVYETKQNLGLVMGLDIDGIESLPFPSDPLPGGFHRDAWEKMDALFRNREAFMKKALENRQDHLMLSKYMQYRKILIKEAQNQLKPKLDLNLTAGYSGLDESSGFGNYFSPVIKSVPGATIGLSLDFTFPVGNNAAKGALVQQKSILEQYRIQLQQSERTIMSAVSTRLFSLKQRLEQLKEASDSIIYYDSVVLNMEKKFKLGMATLSDLLSIKDDLDAAVSEKIGIQQQYANDLIELRYHTAMLIRFTGEEGKIGIENILTMPELSGEIR